jgi:pyruvate,water dikinase
MMPGAVSPLTYSTCARGIDEGWNRIKRAVGLPVASGPEGAYLAMSHGHLFINLSEGVRFATAVTGASPDQQSLAICGRIVSEIEAPAVPSLLVRLPRLVRQLVAVLRPRSHLRRLETLVADGAIGAGGTALESWQRIDARLPDLYEGYQLHLLVSAAAGALASILLGRLAGGEEPSDTHHAIVAAVLSGASGVESADIAEGSERILEALVEAGAAAEPFLDEDAARAARWLESEAAAEAGRRYRAYLERHGHRSLRELDIRQPEWAHDPTPLVRSLQSQLRGRRTGASARAQEAPLPPPAGVERFDRIRPLAHAAVRNRERSKSLLVGLTAHFKRAYRALGDQLVAEGRLPDADAVYFLFHEEIGGLARGDDPELAKRAVARRGLLDYQQSLRFPEVQVGRPQPEPIGEAVSEEGVLVGKPVSRGRVEGRVRVVERLEDAEALEPGEILVAPITDVGWTPYFAVIGGLVTDVGSAVSHGAVVAREYGLPAVLNTRTGTRSLRTGEWVRLDGDRGTVERMVDAGRGGTG